MKKIVSTIELPFLEGDIVKQWAQAKQAWNAAFLLLRTRLEAECRAVFEACGQRPLQAFAEDCENSVHFNFHRERFIFTVRARSGWIYHFSDVRNIEETWDCSLTMVREQTAWMLAQADCAREIVLNTLQS